MQTGPGVRAVRIRFVLLLVVAAGTLFACSPDINSQNGTATQGEATITPDASGVPSGGPSDCPSGPDYIMVVHVQGTPDTAQRIAGYSWLAAQSQCVDAVSFLQSTTPDNAPQCRLIAPAADNPGYDVNARPAPPLKNVVGSFGAQCASASTTPTG